jgi:hypothetical protein
MAWGLVLQFKNPGTVIPLVEYLTKLITGEVVAALIALFYYAFNIGKKNKAADPQLKFNEEQYYSYREFLNKYIKKGSNVKIFCSGLDQFSEFIRTLDLNTVPKNITISLHYRDRSDDTVTKNIDAIQSYLSQAHKLNWTISLVALKWRLTFPSLLIVDNEHSAIDFYINSDPHKPKNTILILGKYLYANLKEEEGCISQLIRGYKGGEYLENFIASRHSI